MTTIELDMDKDIMKKFAEHYHTIVMENKELIDENDRLWKENFGLKRIVDEFQLDGTWSADDDEDEKKDTW